jgi:hypothetical protein
LFRNATPSHAEERDQLTILRQVVELRKYNGLGANLNKQQTAKNRAPIIATCFSVLKVVNCTIMFSESSIIVQFTSSPLLSFMLSFLTSHKSEVESAQFVYYAVSLSLTEIELQ